MGKYVANSRSQEIETFKQPDHCCACGWCFSVDNAKRIAYDKDDLSKTRTQPRTQISHHDDLYCDSCYEELLLKQNRHTKQGSEAYGLYIRGLVGVS